MSARGLLTGAASGAAATTALNAATYLDMAVRGRPTSSVPQDAVQKIADKIGIGIPGQGEKQQNRLQGLAPLAGTAVGIFIGVAAGAVHHALHQRGRRLPVLLESVAIGAGAMALTDTPIAVLGISNPAEWDATDWASDVVPHLIFGAVTSACLRATDA
jgi:hypothetical protein